MGAPVRFIPRVGRIVFLAVLLGTLLSATSTVLAAARVVEFQTSIGNVRLRLYDARTPLTTANFLKYADQDLYDDTFIHRSTTQESAGLVVVQGGGFKYDATSNSAQAITQFDTVQNEPGITNVRGTIGLAKTSGGPSTGTNQWFFNVSDNKFLDLPSNNSFTVFGGVIGNGMSIVDSISGLPRLDLDPSGPGAPNSGLFDEVPIRGIPGGLTERLVYIASLHQITVHDGDYDFNNAVDAADLTLWKSTFGLDDASFSKADADNNGDARIDGADLLAWQRNLGKTFSMAVAIPEPAAATLLATAALLIAARRRRS
jgi:cyclophilin family peptidyl-prolyl cis-trans isomerase